METKRSVVSGAEEILGLYFPVLDHGFVALLDYMGGDSDIVEAARVSYAAGTTQKSSDKDLLRYLLRQHHTSPFEMCELKFHVYLPIFVARQLVRHRTASLNEVSLRYSLPSMRFYVPAAEDMGQQSKKNRQGRGLPLGPGLAQRYQRRWLELQKESVELYRCMVDPDADLARELARLHLPLSLYTRWIWKMDLNNLMHLLSLRCEGHAQWEIQQYANLKAAIMRCVAPLTFQAWLDYSFQSRTFSRMEMLLLRKLVTSCTTAPDGPLAADPHTVIQKYRAEELGMSKREWEEFSASFDPAGETDPYGSLFDAPQFQLDLSKAAPGWWYADAAAESV